MSFPKHQEFLFIYNYDYSTQVSTALFRTGNTRPAVDTALMQADTLINKTEESLRNREKQSTSVPTRLGPAVAVGIPRNTNAGILLHDKDVGTQEINGNRGGNEARTNSVHSEVVRETGGINARGVSEQSKNTSKTSIMSKSSVRRGEANRVCDRARNNWDLGKINRFPQDVRPVDERSEITCNALSELSETSDCDFNTTDKQRNQISLGESNTLLRDRNSPNFSTSTSTISGPLAESNDPLSRNFESTRLNDIQETRHHLPGSSRASQVASRSTIPNNRMFTAEPRANVDVMRGNGNQQASSQLSESISTSVTFGQQKMRPLDDSENEAFQSLSGENTIS